MLLHKHLIHALEEKKARDIQILNVGAFNQSCDFFIIATAQAHTHAKALLRAVADCCKENSCFFRTEGAHNSEWLLVDIGDIVVHIMSENARTYYRLEQLWSIDLRDTSRLL